MKLLEAAANLFWALALCLGIILAVALFLGIMSQARYNQQRKKWANEIRPGKGYHL